METTDPWSILPIKNAKYSKNCTEVHLSDRGYERIANFESFPNLEVLWLNNNKIRKIENLDLNFRVKHLYIENNNLLTLEGSLKRFKFLETFLAGGNNLRGLEKVLRTLEKFTSLVQLSKNHIDLYGNPCAEEPYYRLKVIHAVPSLQVFDRHQVTLQERQHAKKLMQRLQDNIPKVKKTKPQRYDLSVGERELSKEVKKINAKRTELAEEQRKLEESKIYTWDHYKDKPFPRAKGAIANSQHFGLTPESRVSEWEKNEIKTLFVQYDKDKSGYLDYEELEKFVNDIKENKAMIGKEPACSASQVVDIVRTWDKNADGKVHWREFRDGMNQWTWKLIDQDIIQETVQNLYSKAKKEEMNGRIDNAKALVMQALRLQGLDTRTQQIIGVKKELPPSNHRSDFYKAPVYSRTANTALPKTIYNATKPYISNPKTSFLNSFNASS